MHYLLKKMTKKSQEGLTVKKEENFSEWFTQLMIKAEFADYSKVSGCIVYRPLSYALWEKIVKETNKEFSKIGVENTYFPLFIPENLFHKEKEFVEGFAPEVAWVTHGGNTKLGERLAIRPTSEAIMYDSYSKWIRSHRDLPLILNQWNNVVRWEFNNPVPFFRGREFLWNELHSAFASEKEALKHGKKVMKAYKKISEELMAVPGIYGRKTEKEKFAGGVFSEKVHTYLPNGKISEDACFHHDGQNFSKAYEIKFKNSKGEEDFVWQNTHAISTRMLGGMLALHSDNEGVVLPPKIAPNKVVIVPLLFKDSKEKILKKAQKIEKELSSLNPILDCRDYVSPGRKYNEWELKGIPLRIEIGPKDIEKNQAIVKSRIEKEKRTVPLKNLKKEVKLILENMQKKLYENAKTILKKNKTKVEKKEKLIEEIKNKKIVNAPLCNKEICEEFIKSETSGAKALFIDPEKESVEDKKCVQCQNKADYWIYFGKSY